MSGDAPEASALAKRRAAAAGLDLGELFARDPQQWRMLHADEALRVTDDVLPHVAPLLSALYPEAELFEAPTGRWRRVLLYPARDARDLERLDDPAAELAARLGDDVVYRIVEDLDGVRRELGRPLAPEQWRPDAGVDAVALVGPFDDDAAAQAWAEDTVMGSGDGRFTVDTVPHAGRWFADVFRGDLERGGA